jgi:zinc D-Ala-D-Ala carboxypeptidase
VPRFRGAADDNYVSIVAVERADGSDPSARGRVARVGPMGIDPLLADSPRGSGEPDAKSPTMAKAAPTTTAHGRRRATAALVACGVAVVVGFGVRIAAGDDEGDATATTGAAVTAAAVPITTASPTSTMPSIDTPGSLWWLVNPERPLPDGYVPPDLVTPDVQVKPDTGATQLSADTAAAFEAMVADAATAGFQLQLNSGYRSLEQQQMLYDRFVQDFGEEVAAQRVAVPGASEHQTGLAADVGLVGLPDDQLFGDTEASVWVAANAHRFGFVLRYPPEKAEITGYTDEPWHLRYVGAELAAELHASGLTMEEHFGLVDEGLAQGHARR